MRYAKRFHLYFLRLYISASFFSLSLWRGLEREASSFEKPIFFVQDKIRILHDTNVLIGNYFGALKINL